MKEKNNNAGPGIDQHVFELMNGGIDGELTEAEQLELEGVLADSEQLRDTYEKLAAFTKLLDEVPERDSPDYLQSAIERQVRLPLANPDHDQKSGFLDKLLSANWLRMGFAVATGAVLTVGVYEMGSDSINTRDAANMLGTVVKSQVTEPGDFMDSFKLNKSGINAFVELRNRDNLYTLDIQLKSDRPTEFVVNFADRGLEFVGVERGQGLNDAVSVVDGSINVASQGERQYVLMLRRTSEVPEASGLEMDFFADDKLVHEARLTVIPR
jgi:hypothetical protein